LDREYLTYGEQLAKDMNNAFKLCRMDIYKSDKMACRFECTKTPCLVLLNKGQVVHREYDLTTARTAIEKTLQEI
jgi:thioredoxin reductase (NADPH)